MRFLLIIAAPLILISAYSIYEIYLFITKRENKIIASSFIALIIFIILFLDIPVYATIYNYNSMIKEFFFEINDIANEIHTLKINSTYYLFNRDMSQNYIYIATYRYDKNIALIGNVCNETYYNKYIILINNYNNNNQAFMNWLDNNCSAKLIYSYLNKTNSTANIYYIYSKNTQ